MPDTYDIQVAGFPAPPQPGSPGGNVMAIPSFETAHTQTIPLGTNMVQTASWADGGQLGNGKYVRDSVIDSTIATAYPSLIFQAPDEHGDQHYWRFGGERLTPLHMGVRDCINPRSNTEVAYDNKALLAEMWAYGHYLQFTRNIRIELNFVPCQGVGTSEQFEMYGTTSTSWWDSKRLNVVPGRIIAVAPAGMTIPTIENLIRASGRSIQVADGLQWELQGAPWGEVAAGYGHIIAKNLMLIEDAGGSNFGRVAAWGCRRHIVRLSDAAGNNISITLGDVDGARVGNWGTTGDGKFNGTYEDGSYVAALSDDYAQRHRITLVFPDANIDPHDAEIGDLGDYNIVDGAARGEPAKIMAILGYPAANKVQVEIYPCLEQEVSGTYRSMHGGGVDCRGDNLANSKIGAVRVSAGGTVVRLGCEYAPKIETVLGENVGCRLQVGSQEQLKSIQGYREDVHHPENVLYDVIDAAASAFNLYLGTPSNMESSPEGRYGKVLRLSPARFLSGVWTAPHRLTVCGMGWEGAGGFLGSPSPISVEKDLEGTGEAVISNSLQYRMGSVVADNFTFKLLSEPSEALVARRVSAFAGPVYPAAPGTGPASVTFEIDGFEVHPCTIGGTTDPLVMTDFTTPVIFHYTLELDPTGGDAHNWTVLAIPMWQGVPMLGGGGGSSASVITAMPIDPLSLSFDAWFDPSQPNSTYQDTGTATAAAPGDPVGDLRDLTGNSHHATRSSSTLKLRKVGSLYFLDYDGVDDWLKIASLSRSQACTLAAAVLCDNLGSDIGSIFYGNQALQAGDASDWRMYANNVVRGGARDTSPHVLIAQINGASSKFWIDGQVVFTGDTGSANLSGALYLGVASTETSQFYKGALFCAGVGPALTDPQILGLNSTMSMLSRI